MDNGKRNLAGRSPQLVGDGEGGGGEDEVEEDKEERHAGFPPLYWELCFGRALSRWKLYFYFDCRSISNSSWAARMIGNVNKLKIKKVIYLGGRPSPPLPPSSASKGCRWWNSVSSPITLFPGLLLILLERDSTSLDYIWYS